ncbi:MAG: SMR family transporter, partial [Pseudomonadota bacterium]|nr:SMR family transporter [Pseudomonadota bacterium]
SSNFIKLISSISIFVFYAASFVALTFAIKKIEISVAFAVWSGVGTALIALIGILYFKEAATMLKIASIFLIIAGVVGLKVGSNT